MDHSKQGAILADFMDPGTDKDEFAEVMRDVLKIVVLTQTEYEALEEVDDNTIYITTGA